MQKNRFSTSELLDDVRAALTDDVASSVAVALIQSRLDYAKLPTLSVISAGNLAKLQRIQNVGACIVAHRQSKGPVGLHLFNLHWLLIKHWITFKIATLTYKILATGQPGYLHTLLNACQPVRLALPTLTR